MALNWTSPRVSGGTGLLTGASGTTSAPALLGAGEPGSNTQNLMQQYLASLFMRRYNPPAIAQQPGMVGSQMGPGGMQYMAPQVQQAAAPGKTEMQRLQEQMAALQAQMNPYQYGNGADSGW
ncbi:MAG: hypothetical protein LT106_18550 [Burkholderiaceae bacterium]|nr:hypothetical protein [Burkholderiaceae bacterium]